MISILNDQDILDLRYFNVESIPDETLEKLNLIARQIRKDILTMIYNAGSGHPGGSLSSTDLFIMLWLVSGITPENYNQEKRSGIIVSHGHTSSALYAVLGNLGFFNIQEVLRKYRHPDSIYEGHPNCRIPGVEWTSGSLGQGLSVGCGYALASKIRKDPQRVYAVMGDGEQQKGQLTEAREFAVKHKLSNLTAIIDLNGLQASGSTRSIMPVDIRKKYEASDWEVIEMDGHNFGEIYQALKYGSSAKERPVALLASTVMGKGVSFMENKYEYHGRGLTKLQYERAILELGETDLIKLSVPDQKRNKKYAVENRIKGGDPQVYDAGDAVECRTAAGKAMHDLIKNNPDVPIAVLDCDLTESLKTVAILKDFPEKFIECGIQEHNATTVAGALSKAGVLTFFPGFGVFGIDETYGQHRMNDVNDTSVKIIATHCGLDVGEDGKTHQCIDYISLINNLPGYKLIIPADANQTDRVIRYIASTPGNFIVAIGRSKLPVIRNLKKEPFYSGDYRFSYGKADWIREGKDATIISAGTLVHKATDASDRLLKENIHAGILNLSCPGELDLPDIRKACKTGTVVIFEDHLIQSGIGNVVASVIAENGLICNFRKMGIVGYGKSCSADEQYRIQGLSVENLQHTIRSMLNINSYAD